MGVVSALISIAPTCYSAVLRLIEELFLLTSISKPDLEECDLAWRGISASLNIDPFAT